MMGVVLLVLIAFGVFLSPDLRSNPIAVGLAILVLLGAGGLAYGHYLRIRSQQSMIEMNERQRRG